MSTDNTEELKLSHHQYDVLSRDQTLRSEGHDTRVVPKSTVATIDALGIDDDELADMANPTLVDAGGNSGDTLRDVAAACRSVDNPVVVPQSEAESLASARDGLATVVAHTTGIDEDTADSMSCEALSSAVRATDGGESEVQTLTDLSQQPETGGSVESDALEADHDPQSVESLSATERDDLRGLVEKHDVMQSRTPEYAEELREEALEKAPGVGSLDELREAL